MWKSKRTPNLSKNSFSTSLLWSFPFLFAKSVFTFCSKLIKTSMTTFWWTPSIWLPDKHINYEYYWLISFNRPLIIHRQTVSFLFFQAHSKRFRFFLIAVGQSLFFHFAVDHLNFALFQALHKLMLYRRWYNKGYASDDEQLPIHHPKLRRNS